MSNKRTRIALILDKSGSMSSVKNEAIKGFDEAIDEIVETADNGGDTTLSLFTFNGSVDEEFANKDVDNIRRLTEQNYRPNGSTALRDAVGHAIESIQEVDDLEGDSAALVVVVTDGYENASVVWSQNDLAEKIQELEDTGKWTFTFMCANVDPKRIEQEFNVHAGNVAMFTQDAFGMEQSSLTITSSLNSYLGSRAAGETQVSNFYLSDEDENRSNS